MLKIKSFYCNNTKIVNLMRKHDNFDKNKRFSTVVGYYGKAPVKVDFCISQPLSNFDCDVADAIYTLYNAEQTTFTPNQVLITLSGDFNQRIATYNRDEIVESIHRLIDTTIEIDCRQQRFPHNYNSVERIGKAPLLKLSEYVKGKKYHFMPNEHANLVEYFLSTMPLYGYGKLCGQYITFSRVLLDYQPPEFESSISNTLENIQIKRYLIRRLEIARDAKMRLAKADSKTIRMNKKSYQHVKAHEDEFSIVYVRKSHNKGGNIEGMLQSVGIKEKDFKPSSESWKHKRHSIHNTVVKLLDYYKQIGYLEDYSVKKQGKAIYGINILGELRDSSILTKTAAPK